jgi:hypothetical protein
MYTPRFRHRNTNWVGTPYKYETYVQGPSGTCTSPNLLWSTYLTGNPTGSYGTLDYIDDIAGDPPIRGIGLKGYKFHPMTRVKVNFSGGEVGSAWHVTSNTVLCKGQAGQHQTQWRNLGVIDASRLWSTLAIPKDGERLWLPDTPFPYEKVSQLKDLAETAVLAERGKYGESNLYESLFEANRTLGTLNDVLQRARRTRDTIFFKKGGVAKLRSLSNEVAGQYLATRYGFQPLMSDITAILVGLEKDLGEMLRTTKKTERWSDKQTITLSDILDSRGVLYGRSSSTLQELKVTAISLDNVNINLFGALGLGPKDLLSVPWELMTGSFIVDWFANVGDFLGALLPDVGFSNVGTCTVVQWDCAQTTSYVGKGLHPDHSGGQTLTSQTVPSALTRTIFFKNRSSGFAAPSLSWRSDFKFDNLTRCLDTLSLLASQSARVRTSTPQWWR